MNVWEAAREKRERDAMRAAMNLPSESYHIVDVKSGRAWFELLEQTTAAIKRASDGRLFFEAGGVAFRLSCNYEATIR